MKILLTGASGFVGSQLGTFLHAHGADVLGIVHTSRLALPYPFQTLDLRDSQGTQDLLNRFAPDVIVHAAALSRVLDCEDQPEIAEQVNVGTTATLAEWARKNASRLIFVSSDQVFRGDRGDYSETDRPDPINQYGRTKARAERLVLDSSETNLVLRSNSVVGPTIGWGSSFSARMLETLRKGEHVDLFTDQYRSPIHVRKLIRVLDAAIHTGLSGILHAGGPERQSRFDTVRALARAYRIPEDLLCPTSYLSHPRAAAMHPDGSFDVRKLHAAIPGIAWRSIEEEFAEDAEREAIQR